MGQLTYSMNTSQDGYVADAAGEFGWGAPAEDLLAAINDDLSTVGTYLYGRRIYELMTIWETNPSAVAGSPESVRFADTWQRADKWVFSRTRSTVHTSRTQLFNEFDPAAITELKRTSEADLTVDGPTLAASAFEHGLVDRVTAYVWPLVLGGGLAFWPGKRLELNLRDLTRFENGVYRVSYDVQ